MTQYITAYPQGGDCLSLWKSSPQQKETLFWPLHFYGDKDRLSPWNAGQSDVCFDRELLLVHMHQAYQKEFSVSGALSVIVVCGTHC